MSALRLYWPQPLSLFAPSDVDSTDECDSDEVDPVILSFPRLASRMRGGSSIDLLQRSRMLHENRCCPHCGRAAVEPIENEPALMHRDHMPVPGTGELLAFRCSVCTHEWDAA